MLQQIQKQTYAIGRCNLSKNQVAYIQTFHIKIQVQLLAAY